MKCNRSEECGYLDCHHNGEHAAVDYFGNSCFLSCDVRGGISGAECIATNKKDHDYITEYYTDRKKNYPDHSDWGKE